jgi:tripartite-type tricarboxylate transporter receptor subunit TctC
MHASATRRLLTSAIAATFVLAGTASAQSAVFPSKPVDITVGYAPGGGVDLLARLISTQLSQSGQSVIVENRPGAGSTLGTRYVSTRPKDGHSLLMTNDAYSLAPALYKTLGYDPRKDLDPVINVAYAPMLILVPATSKIQSMADLVARARAEEGKLTYASCGTGTDPHLAGEMMNMAFKIKTIHVPYKGCAPAIVDAVGGQVDLAVVTISGAMPHIAAGKLRALAITSKERSPVAPSVPTVAESGAPGYNLSQWQGLFVPAGTPEATKTAIYNAVSTIMKSEAMQKRLADLGYTPASDGPQAFQKIVHEDIDRFGALAKQIGLTLD